MNISFLGMGAMGAPMAVNLAKSRQVKIWNRTQSNDFVDFAVRSGCELSKNIHDAVKRADLVFLCLPDIPDVEQVLFGIDGISESLKSGCIIVDCSTIGKSAALDFSNRISKKHCVYVDAPVSGGDIGAKNATLSFFVGCSHSVLGIVEPVLMTMGANLYHCGSVGSGQAVKMINQHLCAVHMLAVSEAASLAKAAGIKFDKVVEFCSTGAAVSWALENLGRAVANGDYTPGFKVSLMLKDLRLIKCEAEDLELPALNLAWEKFEDIQSHSDFALDEVGTQAMALSYLNKIQGRL